MPADLIVGRVIHSIRTIMSMGTETLEIERYA
jgi:hypothetical protein